jgi:hypothetical protein
MADWKFTDDYGSAYPALQSSFLAGLAFSSHSLNGTAFSGTLDVAASGTVLQTMGVLVGLSQIGVAGTVTNTSGTLTVTLRSTDAEAFKAGVARSIPLIGGSVTQAAWMDVQNVTKTTDTADDGPTTDALDLGVTFAVGSASVTIVSQVPMGNGFFTLSGTFTGVGISLEDLGFLFGTLGTNNQWFPSTQLGPYSAGSPQFGLLSMSLTGYVQMTPTFRISVSDVTVEVGITALPLMPTALYLDPLGVWVTVTDPTGAAAAHWGLEGAVKLCNYATPGPGGLSAPDFIFDFQMAFPDSTNPGFVISGNLENPSGKSVNVMLQDLMGPSTNIGIADDLTVDTFQFDTVANTSTGTISEFSTSIAMSGEIGIFQSFSLESFSVSVSYSGD